MKKAWASLFKKAGCNLVQEEPYVPMPRGVVFAKDSTTRDPNARADILARGLFTPQQDAYLDIAVVDTAAKSYVDRKESPQHVLSSAESRKRNKYGERVQHIGSAFAPLVHSVYGTLAPEAEKILSLVVNRLDRSSAEKEFTVSMQRVYLQTAVLKAMSMCLRARGRREPVAVDFPEALEDCRVADADTAARHWD